ncbi:MAG: beta-propeller domain-containing protein [Thermoplasmatota archaeon]
MALEIDTGRKDTTKMLTMTIIAAGLVLLLVVPLLGVLIFDGEEGKPGDVTYLDQSGAVTGDASMDSTSREAWENYLKTAPSIELVPHTIDTALEDKELELIDSLPGDISETTDYQEEPYPPTDSGAEGGDDALSDDDERDDKNSDQDGSGGEREVEEADIVKAVGNRIYVLNNYMGFLSVNMEDPSDPYIEGRTPVLGTPVSMYIVDFLGFVIASNAPSLDGSEGGSSGRLYILDLTDNTEPRIVETVELDGYPLDSRRVGEVIYIISNDYMYYDDIWRGGWVGGGMEVDMAMEEGVPDDGFEETGPTTTIVSIGFYHPESLGEVDRQEISGDSAKIHASQFAIFIPQTKGDWDKPRTDFVYVDISDPNGEIKVRGTITIDGYLRDRYQMDHYKGMFRVVTQENPTWEGEGDRFPSSTLYIVDCRDPDEMEVIADLLIDDEGNLMATRFEGDRGYTIHLPEAIDPLDVLDLSDPDDPRLTDILEIPGWVEHMEVIGYNIIAVGVDNENERKVALYLFDVTDPEKAVLEDHVVIGDGYTYSEANWDPKALTILKEEGVVVVPYSSYKWDWYGTSESGVQLVSFDLENGDLEVRGKITGTSPVTRSRSVNGNLVTTSDRVLQSIDYDNLDAPVIEAVLDLASNVKDAFIVEDKVVSLVLPDWQGSGAKVRISEIATPYDPIMELGPEGLQFEDIVRSVNMVFIKGIRQGPDVEGGPFWELHAYDLSDPNSPVTMKNARMTVPEEFTSQGYYYKERDMMIEDDDVTAETAVSYVYHDPFSWQVIDGPAVALFSSYYYYYYDYGYYEKGTEPVEGERPETERVFLFHWDTPSEVQKRSIKLPADTGISSIVGGWDGLFIQSYNWNYGSELFKVTYYRGVEIVTRDLIVQGRLIGASEDLGLVYTALDYWWENAQHNTLNVYDVSSGSAEFVMGVDLGLHYSQVSFQGDRVVVISQDYGYPWYYEGYPEDDVVYDDVAVDEGEDTAKEPAPPEGDELPPEWQEPEYKTTVHVLGIQDGIFETHETYTVDGIYYSSIIVGDMVLLNKDFTMLGISMAGEELEEIGPWSVHGYVQGGDISGNTMVVAMGLWGIETLEL